MQDENKTIQEETNEAIQRGFDKSESEWKEMAFSCVHKMCLAKSTFTIIEVRELIESSPYKTHDMRALGGIMRACVSAGWIERTGETIPSRISHGMPLQVWRSKLYKPKQTLF